MPDDLTSGRKIRLSNDLWELIQREAAIDGVSPSEFVRRLVEDRLARRGLNDRRSGPGSLPPGPRRFP